MKGAFFRLCSLAILLLLAGNGKTQTVSQLEKERKATLDEIETTNSLLKETSRSEKNTLNRLSLLARQIDSRKQLIHLTNKQIETINNHISSLNHELAQLKHELAEKRQSYARSLQAYQQRRSTYDKFLFILSADNASQAFRRMRYLREYAEWQKRQGVSISEKQLEVTLKQKELQQSRKNKQVVLKTREEENDKLTAEETRRKEETKQLGRRKAQLQAQLQRKEMQAQALNRRIEQLIAEETAKAKRASKGEKGAAQSASAGKLTADFAANKGKLPAPLDKKYTVLKTFGEQQHQEFKHVRTVNSGVDLQTLPGTNARAVFAGEVSRIFAVPGFNTSVIIRHGSYLTVYSNLSQVFVKTGDKVTARQTIGHVYSDPESGDETILHFQIRKEKDKMDPLLWIAP
ncbi:MAG: peptidoglycan DD-metalloendopeptidase family protein [Tannerellaceae bacterium]|jgi:septal ring factor EnvC (AmiA/AmiB activator)|nr:peptidoglycan DD-metalloendopeptidase family protein [Tannerellaceae bacterium]